MTTAPEFVAGTNCLPPGRYAMQPADFERRFVTGEEFADSVTRSQIWAEWNEHLTFLHTVTGNKISRAWISGSFVSAKTNPKDIDVTYFIESSDYEALDEDERTIIQNLIDVKWCLQKRLRIDPYLIPARGSMKYWELERQDLFSPAARESFLLTGLYDEVWGRVKGQEDGLSIRRGYVEVLL
ncbi:DUF6932 family protein [Streptomyces sp. NPDC007903]|uniref:DUF6932 family protein n=1 Tax=Streptomyces sp. NPDC007903 TaxID=3364786 RepID=UPI0036E009B2